MLNGVGIHRLLAAATFVLAGTCAAMAAEAGAWSVSKSSGEVWLSTSGATPAALTQEATLKAGDTVRTGPNGRVLLVRGEETILMSPNSVIGLPTEPKDGMSTTILQQAGSILLDVEKQNAKHFEVETPYLAAVVKGTHFQVTVNASNTRVDVQRGQVEVSDFKTGQVAQVMPGQAATSFFRGKPGLTLSGSGTFSPIEHGRPRSSTIERIPVPRGGLHAPQGPSEGKLIRALGPGGTSPGKSANSAATHLPAAPMNARVIHLRNALGEVHLNIGKATHGLAHGSVMPGTVGNASRDTARNTIWSNSNSGTAVSSSVTATATDTGNSVGNGISAPSSLSPGSTPGLASAMPAGSLGIGPPTPPGGPHLPGAGPAGPTGSGPHGPKGPHGPPGGPPGLAGNGPPGHNH